MKDKRENGWRVGSYQYPLEAVIAATVEQWMSDRAISWVKHPHANAIIEEMGSYYSGPLFSKDEVFDIADKCAKSLICMMDRPNMQDPESEDPLVIVLNAPNEELSNIIKEHLQAELMVRGIGDRNAAGRLFQLASARFILSGVELHPDVVNYFGRAVRTYVRGLDAECIALCRSALEAALEARVSYDTCVERLGPRNKREGRYTLRDRLHIARLEGLLNGELTKVVEAICERANKVLHEDAKLTQRVDSTIHETARVVCALTTGHDPYPPIPSWASDVPEILD
jgi:hypothetical protein